MTWFTENFWRDLGESAARGLVTTAPSVLLILVLALFALRAFKLLLPRLRELMILQAQEGGAASHEEIEKRTQTLLGIISAFARVGIWSLALLLILQKLGVNVAPLIAGVGILGLAVGFGAQELVRDVISGFFILLENQVRVGDVAIVNGTGGLVEKMNLRTLTLRDQSGVVHVFQNGKVNTLSNMTKGWSAMVFDIGIAYKEDTDRVVEVMRGVFEELAGDSAFKEAILEPMEIFGVDSFGDSAVVVRGRIKTRPIQQWSVGREYRRRLKKAFDREGIELPFPHRTIYWGEASPPLQHVAGSMTPAAGPIRS